MIFPIIQTIADVLPALAGREEFVVADKGAYTVIDYRYTLSDSFDDPLRAECRGLKFAPDGRLLARPLHKFFNYGEKAQSTHVDFSQAHEVMEKMDGSMIHPCQVDVDGYSYEGVRLMTRMGVTDVSKQAERLFMQPDFADQLGELLDDGFTPIFEYVGPHNRIVEAYAEPKLVLLHIRDNYSGAYVDARRRDQVFGELRRRAWQGAPTMHDTGPYYRWLDKAPTYPEFGGMGDIESIYARAEGEGVVIRFDDGLFVKVKTEEYRRLHGMIDPLANEHEVVGLILDGKLDDCMAILTPDSIVEARTFADAVNRGIMAATMQVRSLVLTGAHLDQKTFATDHVASAAPIIRTCAFLARRQAQQDGIVDCDVVVRDMIRANLISSGRLERVRPLIGGARCKGILPHLREAA